ncbi:MAG: AAA family ATPase, partial [Candidatus Krumholzibacteria bacterium]|nr:AAA family ATPase [Candidatus Krumholzibacteria bacterium]
MASNEQQRSARWIEQLEKYLSLKTMVILHGNIYDRVPFLYESVHSGRAVTYLNIRSFLRRHYFEKEYRVFGLYDLVDGIHFDTPEEYELFDAVSSVAKKRREAGGRDGSADRQGRPMLRRLEDAAHAVREAAANDTVPLAVVFDFASRLLAGPSGLSLDERSGFVTLIKGAEEAACVENDGKILQNQILLICDKLNDLPAWVYLNNPLVGSIQIDPPSDDERRDYFISNIESFGDPQQPGFGFQSDRNALIDHFTGHTSGLRYYDLQCLQKLARDQQPPMPVQTERDIRKLIDLYKFGIRENPWESINDARRAKIKNAKEKLSDRVKGQDMAIEAVIDVLKRAVMGLSGVQHSSRGHKPRGVLFFAGPTGVGKTEMAKALADLLFEDEDACIRFDMSEYSTSQSGERLMGAPPGYVGYQEGGQLTNRVKAHPFCVLLFDEIEKADPSILDKFLQILEDGRMTDGRGETVYFSESIIIFTSNIGTYVKTDRLLGGKREANIKPRSWRCASCEDSGYFVETPGECPVCGSSDLVQVETPYSEVRRKILEAIQDEFKGRMGRPELYNRFGNNFVVFDYIRTPVLRQIVEKNLGRVTDDLLERKKVAVSFSPQVVEKLIEQVSEEGEMGARGVGNRIETVIVNPLARALFDEDVAERTKIVVRAMIEERSG